MKTFGKILTAAVLLGGTAAPAFAQATSTQTTTSSVTILQPIVLTKTKDLLFGSIVRPSAGTTVVDMPLTADVPTLTGGTNPALIASSTANRAAYTVTGEGGQAISITVPASAIMLSGANSITVTLTKSIASPSTLTGTIGTTGGFTGGTLYVGGSFNLPSTQASGAYTVTFPTTVAYN